MLDSEEVINEGFRPLKRTPTEPVPLPSKPEMNRAMSFNTETGEKESSQALWEQSRWEKLGRARGRTMDRANSFIGAKPPVDASNKEAAIVIVDPFSTGAHLAAEVCTRGYICVRVLSAWDSPVAALIQAGLTVDFSATVQHNDRNQDQQAALDESAQALRDLPFPILAVIPGAETGVELADQLAVRLGVRNNGIEKSLARRNKYYMGEAVRDANVRAVKQAICTTEAEMKSFLDKLIAADPSTSRMRLKCVVKPVQSAGTDDVFLCSSVEEAETAFRRILGKINGLGLLNSTVLVQEFLEGKEYVIDKVSVDGVHKLVGIWEYDKRSVNNANFVYFGMRLQSSDTEKAQVMVRYADQVLDALDINQGPSHMEVMLKTLIDPSTGEITYDPCLVEVGARCHGGEGTWLEIAKECMGFNKVMAVIDAYTTQELFRSLDKDHYPLLKAGREVDMVSRQGGIVRGFPGEALLRKMPSFRSISWEVKPGDYIPVTIDCFTRPGSVQLVGDTEEIADRDFEYIHQLEQMGLIDYSVICPKPPTTGAVVIIDPFSSGANMAAMVLSWGFKLILVFSEKDSPVANLVSAGSANIKPTLMIQHDSSHPNQDFAIAQTLKEIDSQSSPVLAIIPGAETGVELCDRLAARYKTRCNGEKMTEARRNKFIMQETIKAKGVRAVEQKLAFSVDDVLAFWDRLVTLNGDSDANCKCVVKPNESAGSDSIFLCRTKEQLLSAFKAIHGKRNGLGLINEGALCQEFLQGKEYVVDGVSRDGVYKVMAIWEYDKRSVNGANFVYFGMSLKDPHATTGEEAAIVRALVTYARQVVNALEIMQGPSHMEVMLNSIPAPSVPGVPGNVSAPPPPPAGGSSSISSSGSVQYVPCLVEVGARCHGGEATWLPVVEECIGYSQLDTTLNAYLRPDRFDALPFVPTLRNYGCEAFMVSYSTGTLQDIPGIDKIRELKSFRRMEMMTQPGAALKPTIDCFTRPGSVQMVAKTKEELLMDYDTIRALEKDGLFVLQS